MRFGPFHDSSVTYLVPQKLKEKSVLFVVAPYEADAQLAFLMQNGLADAVLTEDSDCLPFGCHTVLFKLDKDGDGLVHEIKLENFKNNSSGSLGLDAFTHEMVRTFVVFAHMHALHPVQ